jgi:peptidoglycan/LPS O-acetylase OafA/YrhL
MLLLAAFVYVNEHFHYMTRDFLCGILAMDIVQVCSKNERFGRVFNKIVQSPISAALSLGASMWSLANYPWQAIKIPDLWHFWPVWIVFLCVCGGNSFFGILRKSAILGKISYSMYLVHPAVIRYLAESWSFFDPRDPKQLWDEYDALMLFPKILLVVSLTCIISSLTYEFIEETGNKFGRALLGPREEKQEMLPIVKTKE